MSLDGKLPVRNLVSILHTGASCEESLYRTRWLIAHNRLHALTHDEDSGSAQDVWNEYLTELETSEDVAGIQAFELDGDGHSAMPLPT